MVREKTTTTSLLIKMALRTLKESWSQFLALVLIGTIAVTLFTGLLSNAQSFSNQVNSVYSMGKLPDLYVTTETIDDSDKEGISALLSDEDSLDSRFYLTAKNARNSFYLGVTEKTPTLSVPYSISGTESDTDFCYVDSSLSGNYKLNETISLTISLSGYGMDSYFPYLNSFVLEGKTNPLIEGEINISTKVTGHMSHPENITKSSYNNSLVLMSDSTFRAALKTFLETYYNETGCYIIATFLKAQMGLGYLYDDTTLFAKPNQYLIKLGENTDTDTLIENIQSYYKSKAENNLLLVAKKEQMPFYITMDSDVKQAQQFTYVFPFVFYLVAILVILTTLRQRILKERNQIGILKALGVKKRDIYLYYFSITFFLIGLAIILGYIIGPILIPAILGNKYNLLYSLPTRQYVFPVVSGLLSGFIFLFASLLVTFLTCYKQVREKPTATLRPIVKKIKRHVKTRSEKQKVSSLSLKMSFRNIFLDKGKALMVIIGVLGCSALLVCGYGIEDTLHYGINYDMETYNGADISLEFKSGMTKAQVDEFFLDYDENIESYEPNSSKIATYMAENGNQSSNNLYILAQENGIRQLSFDTGGVAVSEKMAETLDLKVNETIRITIGSNSYTTTVVKIYKTMVYNGVMIFASHPIFKTEPLTYSGCYITVKEGGDIDALSKKFTADTENIQSSNTQEDWRNHITDILSSVFLMTNAVKIFAILLAIVVLYNLSLMNFKERSRDIATLKVLGFKRSEIALSLLFETLTLTLIGSLVGLFMGYPFLLAVLNTNKVELVQYLFHINLMTYLISFLLTFGVAVLVNLIFIFRIKKVKMVESLKSVE